MNKRPLSDYINFIEAWILLHAMKLAILILPFKRIASRIGKVHSETSLELVISDGVPNVEQAIRRASRFTIHQSKCYDQALTGKLMLQRRGLSSTLYFGLAKDTTNLLKAHAWVRCGNRIITGRAVAEGYTVIVCFGN
jgi:hypothetical protein